MKTLFAATLLAALGGVLIAVLWKPQPVEAQLLHLRVEQVLPEYAGEIGGESAELQALFVDYAHDPVLAAKARLALLRHPDMARRILPLYGDLPEFREVLRRYGEDVLLPIQYFLANEVLTLEIMRSANRTGRAAMELVRRLWSGMEGAPPEAAGEGPGAALTAEERGWYAVQFLQSEGYDFLGQFVLGASGEVAWVQTERVLEGINAFFAGGVRGLESRVRRDEPVGAGDVGWAAVDVAIGIGAFKVLRMGKATAAGRSMTFSQRSAVLGSSLWRGSAIGARLVKYGAPAVLAYVAVRHPSVLNSLFGQAAESLGLPVPLVQALGWTLVLLPVILVGRLLLRSLAAVLGGLAIVLRQAARLAGTGGAVRSAPAARRD